MSRRVMHLAVLAMVAAGALVSCDDDDDDLPKAVGPVHVNFTCDGVPTISLTDSAGTPAWTIERHRNDPVSWVVGPNVTIDSIWQKNGQPLPIDSAGVQGRAAGASFLATVKSDAHVDSVYHYNIKLTCDPASGPNVPLIADPEMILR